jgi:hypothetical protein
MDPTVKAAIASIAGGAWAPIEYPQAVDDVESGRWISRAEVAEVGFTDFGSRKRAAQVPGRLVVRRIPDLARPASPGQGSLFPVWRFHAFVTTSALDTVTAGTTHRGHAIIEQVTADLKYSALAHLPSARAQLPASSDTVRDGCLADVDTCDPYVLILGHRYGFQPLDGNPEGLSITHLEFRRARQAGEPRVALLRTSIPDVSLADIADPPGLLGVDRGSRLERGWISFSMSGWPPLG